VGFLIELKSNSVRRGSDLLEFSSWIRGNCGRIVALKSEMTDSQKGQMMMANA
jgi:hypothetical protein